MLMFPISSLGLRFVGPGVDATEFTDVGVVQFRQCGQGRLAAIPAAAVFQKHGLLFGISSAVQPDFVLCFGSMVFRIVLW